MQPHAQSEQLMTLTARMCSPAGGFSVFAGVGERTREGNDLYHEMIQSVRAAAGRKHCMSAGQSQQCRHCSTAAASPVGSARVHRPGGEFAMMMLKAHAGC